MAVNIYSGALMDHHAHPDYKYAQDDATHTQEGINPSCGDEMVLYLKVEGSIIKEASFTGHGCAISQASADIMAELITDESLEEAQRLSQLFVAMIRGDKLSEQDIDDLDEAYDLEAISKMPARVKCAELAWRTLEHILANEANN